MGPSGPTVSEWSSLATGMPASVVVGLGCGAVMLGVSSEIGTGTAVLREVTERAPVTSLLGLDASGAEIGWCASAGARPTTGPERPVGPAARRIIDRRG